MGPVRHRQLIRLLALVVALDLVVGVAALYTRGGPAIAAGSKARNSRAAELPDAAAGAGTAPGEAPSGKFSKRQGSQLATTGPATNATTGGSSAPPRSAPSSSTSPGPAPTAGSSTSAPTRATTPSSGPASTTSTSRSVTSSTAPATTAPTNGSTGGNRPARTQFTWIPLEDTAGDPVVEGTDKRRSEDRADIVRAQAAYTASLIALSVQTAQNVNPGQDRHWRSSSTFQAWELDVNGDAKADFEVQFVFDAEQGTVGAGVSRVGDVETDTVCEAQAQYWSGGYATGFDPACVGSPAAFSYRVKTYFDSNPDNADADVLTDTAPNGGLSRPVARQSD